MEEVDDDFGELYADVEVQVSSAINGVSDFTQLDVQQQHQKHQPNYLSNEPPDEPVPNSIDDELAKLSEERTEKNSERDDIGDNEENGSDSEDDDFNVVVNDDDYPRFCARNCAVDRRGYIEVREDEGDEFVAVSEGERILVNGGGVEQGVNGCCGDKGSMDKNGCNGQHKHVRRYGSVFVGNDRAISSRRTDKEEIAYVQNRRSSLGRVAPVFPGLLSGSAEHGSGFWLPWYRTIFDVNIDAFAWKPWASPGADMTDYFNFGLDGESWKHYSRSLDQLRKQIFTQNGNQVNEGFGSKLANEAGSSATDELQAKDFVDGESMPDRQRGVTSQEPEFAMRLFKRQTGRAIHVADSNTERQPSEARRPRNWDPDVVIQISVHDPDDSCSSGKKEQDDMHETQCQVAENGCDHGKVESETERSKACEMATNSIEESLQSPSRSSDIKRSYESATGSSHMLQDSNSQGKGQNSESSHMLQDSSGQGKGQNSESDIRQCAKMNNFSEEDARAVETINSSMEDIGMNTIETNRVAGIDLLFDDIQSTPTPDSDIQSLASEDGLRSDLRRPQHSQRSSSNSGMEGHQVVEDDYRFFRRNQRDGIKRKMSGNKYPSRVGSPVDEDWDHCKRRVQRHSELKSHSDEDGDYHVGIAEHMYDRAHSRAHRHRSTEKMHALAFDGEDWPTHRERESSLGRYGTRSVGKMVRGARMRDSYQQEHWGPRDEIDVYSRREWDEKEFSSKRRIRRMRGEIVERGWYFHERECMISNDKPLFRNQPHFSSKYPSSIDVEPQNKYRYDDVPFSKRSKHDLSLEYRYSDGPVLDKYARSDHLKGQDKEYFSDIERERHIQHTRREIGACGRGDQYFKSPVLDMDYPWYIRDDDEYLNQQTLSSIHDYRDSHPAYTERRRDFSLGRDDVDDPRFFQRHRRHGRSFSPEKGRADKRLYGQEDAYDRQHTNRYLDEDNYFHRERSLFQSEGMNWTEDELPRRCFNNNFCDEDMLDKFQVISRHERPGARHRFFRGGISMHRQIMKHGHIITKDGGGKSCDASSKMPPKVKHEQPGIWCRNTVEVRHGVRESKTLQSTGKGSKAGSASNNDARPSADRILQKQQRKQQQLGETGTGNGKSTENNKPSVAHRDDASDLEEGQIPTDEPPTCENLKEDKRGSEQAAKNGGLKRRTSGNVKPRSQNDDKVYDENRILETMAKMEKRRERFQQPVILRKEIDSDPKPLVNPLEVAEPKQERPARKRRWGGS